MKQSILLAGALAMGMALGFTGCQTKKADTTQEAKAETAAKQIPMEDFFRNPEKTAFTISPDGKHIAWRAPWEGRMNIFVQTADGDMAQAKRITSEKARDIAGMFFGNNGRIIYIKDFGGDENFHIVSVDIDGGDAKDLTPWPKVRASVVDDLPQDPLHMLIQHNKRDARYFDVYRLNIETGKMDMVAQNPGGVDQWVTDHDGKVRAAVQADGVNQKLLYRDSEKDAFKTILTTNFKEGVSPQHFTPDNKGLYVLSNRGRDKTAAFEFDPQTAKEGRLIFEHPEVDLEGLEYSRFHNKLVAAYYTDYKYRRKDLDPIATEIFEKIDKALGHGDWFMGSRDSVEQNFIVREYGDRRGGTNYLFNTQTGKLTKLADLRPWLDANQLAEMKPVQFKSRDGLTINGYLTLPKGVAPKNLPVIMNIHGGPWARDEWAFNPEVQFLANRGYAVMQVNYRGSTGYGRKFWEASFKQWGRTMQNDITDAVEWLKTEGIADPKRVGIYGGSYGGYATLAGVTFTPDLYAAAVDYVGVSNMFTFMNTIPPYWESFRGMMHEMVGNPKDPQDSVMLAEVSPALHVDKIKTPLFVAQGKNDPRVNLNESDQIVNNLKKRGVEVEYMVKDNEGHGFHNEENRYDFYRAMEKFFAQHLGEKKEEKKKEPVIG